MQVLNCVNIFIISKILCYFPYPSLQQDDVDTESTIFFLVNTPKGIHYEDVNNTDNTEMTVTDFVSTAGTQTSVSPGDEHSDKAHAGEKVRKSYSGYSILSIQPSSPEQLYEVLNFELKGQKYNFWSHRRVLGAPLVVLISPNETELTTLLRVHKIDYIILLEDPQAIFDEEKDISRSAHPSLTGITFNAYLRYDIIVAYMKQLSSKYSEMANLLTIGKSVENRNILVLEVKKRKLLKNPVGSVLIDAGMHGREWLSVSLALYAINQLVEHAAANIDMLFGITWYILPVLNPDGYEYSHTTDRLWKTNREPLKPCYGVDLNRNFATGILSRLSSRPSKELTCTNIFPGNLPDSEPETKALENFMKKNNITVYLNLHSGETFIAQPWAKKIEKSADYDIVQEMALVIKMAIEKHDNSSNFIVDTLSSICGLFDGAAIDWAKQHEVPYSLMISLKGAAGTGFDVSSQEIYPSVTAAFEGLRAVANYLQGMTLDNDSVALNSRIKQTNINSGVICRCINVIFVIGLVIKVVLPVFV